jgi:hypothetical protein
MSAQKRKSKAKSDPVVPGQGGRLTAIDPMDPTHASREKLVRLKAYELYEQRGKTDGHAVDDWVEAESKLDGRESSYEN